MIHWSYLTERNVLCIVDTRTHDRSFYSLATSTLIFSFMYRQWHISFLSWRIYLWINSYYQVDVSGLCTASAVMLMIILILRVVSGCSHPLGLTWHFFHPGLSHVILLFAFWIIRFCILLKTNQLYYNLFDDMAEGKREIYGSIFVDLFSTLLFHCFCYSLLPVR